jgi:DNA processing protein
MWTSASWIQARVAQAIDQARDLGVLPVHRHDPRYPSRLAEIPDPSPVLWVHGRADVLERPCVAIVGSRAGSSYSLSVAERLGADLATRGVVVVSGLARGVDAAAHRGAVGVNGPTVGVLGCGVDIAYPPEHVALIGAVRHCGAVVSELAPSTAPRPIFFPRRNRVISGLSLAVVVVEAGERSGSLITARSALEQGRDVLAVPGNVLTGRNKGGHALLRDGARLVEGADDIIDELAIGHLIELAPASAGRVEDGLLSRLPQGEACDADQIATLTGLSVGTLLPRLLELELEGKLIRKPGGRFLRLR